MDCLRSSLISEGVGFPKLFPCISSSRSLVVWVRQEVESLAQATANLLGQRVSRLLSLNAEDCRNVFFRVGAVHLHPFQHISLTQGFEPFLKPRNKIAILNGFRKIIRLLQHGENVISQFDVKSHSGAISADSKITCSPFR